MSLFRDINTLGRHAPFLASADFNTVKIFLEKAEHRYLRSSVLGISLYDYLHTLVQTSTVDVEPPNLLGADDLVLLDKCRSAVAFFGAHMASGITNVSLASGGMSVGSSDNLKPADKNRVDQANKALQAAGFHALDQLIEYLFAKSNEFPNPHVSWTTSDFYRVYSQGVIRTMAHAEMSGVNLGGSCWLLSQLKPAIQRAEEVVKKILPEGEFTLILNALNGTTGLSAAHERLLDTIRPALIHTALGEMVLPLSSTLDVMGLWAFEASGSTFGGPKQASVKEKQAIAEHYVALGARGMIAVEELAHELSDDSLITAYPSTTTDPHPGYVDDTDRESYSGSL